MANKMSATHISPNDRPILSQGTKLIRRDEVPYYLLLNPLGFSYARLREGARKVIEMCTGVNSVHDIAAAISEQLCGDVLVVEDSILKLISELVEINLLTIPNAEPNFQEFTSKFHPYEVWLHLTQKCNLRCKTCYSSSGVLVDACSDIGLETICELLDDCKAINTKEILLSGGEPFMRSDLLEVLIEIKRRNLWIHLITNATLIDARRAARLKDIGVDFIQVSLDGSCAQVNDRNRGAGSFDAAMRGAAELRAAGLSFSLYPTATKLNRDDFGNMFDRFTEFTGRDRITAAYFCPVGRGSNNQDDLELAPAEIIEIGELIQHKKAAKKGVGRCDFLAHYERELPAGYRKTNCGFGSDVISVAHDGSVFPCQWLHTEEFLAGNIKNTRFSEIYYNSEILRKCRNTRVDSNIRGCHECDWRYYCGGGCRALSLRKLGDLQAKCPLCELHKAGAEKAVWGIDC